MDCAFNRFCAQDGLLYDYKTHNALFDRAPAPLINSSSHIALTPTSLPHRHLEPALALYRHEGWTELLSTALRMAMKCAAMLCNPRLYLACAVELSGQGTDQQRAESYENVTRLLQVCVSVCLCVCVCCLVWWGWVVLLSILCFVVFCGFCCFCLPRRFISPSPLPTFFFFSHSPPSLRRASSRPA